MRATNNSRALFACDTGSSRFPALGTEIADLVTMERHDPSRLRLLRATEARPHRFHRYRALTMLVTLAALLAVPSAQFAAFDVLGDDHRVLGRQVTALSGFIGIMVAIFGFYLATFVINLIAGRMFCGWGCPIGHTFRLTDSLMAARSRLRSWLFLYGFAALTCYVTLLWWMRPSAFVTPSSAPLAFFALAATTGGLVVFARVIGWNFCMKACPVGLYYSVVQQARPMGIQHEPPTCLYEDACVRICPVDLDPKNLDGQVSARGGLAFDGLTAHNHCLRCGLCVEACELATSKIGKPALRFARQRAPEKKRMKSTLTLIAVIALFGACEPEDWSPERLQTGASSSVQLELRHGEDVYRRYCVGCHGENGDGKGPAAAFLNPKPRDFTRGRIKFAMVESGEAPREEDYRRVIDRGLRGTAMPSFSMLPGRDKSAVIAYLRTFYPDRAEDPPGAALSVGQDPWVDDPEGGVKYGREAYHGVARCWSCHPAYEKLPGDGVPADAYQSKVKDSQWGEPITAPDFYVDRIKTGFEIENLAMVVASGVGGTAMPTWAGSLEDEQIWGIAYYVNYLAMKRGDAPSK